MMLLQQMIQRGNVSMLPLKGCSSAVSFPSAMGMSMAVAPGELDVRPRGVEVRVADEDLARPPSGRR
jgi:hypothetical protein